MNTNFDEPTLTAFALGEIDDASARDAVAAHVAADESARAHVEEVRATAQLVSVELARESEIFGVGLTAMQYANIERRLDGREPLLRMPDAVPTGRNWGLWGSIAASVLIVGTVMASVLPMLFREGKGKPGTGPQPHPGNGQNTSVAEGPTIRFLPADERPDAARVQPSTQSFATRPIADPFDPSVAGFPDAFPWRGPGGIGSPPSTVDGFGASAGAGFRRTTDFPRSTFALRTETTAYDVVRQAIEAGRRPAREAVRIDQLLNAFTFGDAAPVGDRALALSAEVAACPWNAEHRLVRIAIKARPEDPVAAKPTTQPQTNRSASRPAIAAWDVRLQVEFNPAVAGAYRLIGQEGRALPADAFDGDDGGRGGIFGAGQSATALYEVVPAGREGGLKTAAPADALKYQRPATLPTSGDELLTAKLRYRRPAEDIGRLDEVALRDGGTAFASASERFRFASAVAAFGLALAESEHRGSATLEGAAEMATESKGADADGRRAAFADLARKAAKTR